MPRGDKRLRKEQIFVREYLIDRNASRAAIQAGYSKKGAGVAGTRMLKNPNVRAELARLSAAQEKALESSAIASKRETLETLTEFLRNAFIKPEARIKAAGEIAKLRRWIVERKELSGPGGKPIEAKIESMSLEEIHEEIARLKKLRELGE